MCVSLHGQCHSHNYTHYVHSVTAKAKKTEDTSHSYEWKPRRSFLTESALTVRTNLLKCERLFTGNRFQLNTENFK